MKTAPSNILIEASKLDGSRFKNLSFRISQGTGLMIHSESSKALTNLIDVLFGLERPSGGSVSLFGGDPYSLDENQMISLMAGIGYASLSEEMISNLRVWENLVLPLQARSGKMSDDEMQHLEGEMLEAFDVAGFSEASVASMMVSAPDSLESFETSICSLIRCHLSGFELLVCENLRSGLGGAQSKRLENLLNWMGARHENPSLLVLHQGDEVDLSYGLTSWPKLEHMSLLH